MSTPIRVIFADDHPIVRRGLVAVVDAEDDIQVVGEASDGAEAIRLARTLDPDVMLIDLKMPTLDGVEAIRAILAAQPEIKAIILTSYADDDHIYEGITAGAKGYLLKDAPPERLVEAIRAAHRGESLLSPGVAARILEQFSSLMQQSVVEKAEPALPSSTAPKLTRREKEVLFWLARGARNKEIAERLVIVEPTVKIHVRNIFSKLGVSNRTEAVIVATDLGLLGRADYDGGDQ